MKPITYIQKILPVSVGMLILLITSCADNQFTGPSGEPATGTIRFTLSVPEAAHVVGTRAATPEHVVTNLDVISFRVEDNGEEILDYYYSVPASDLDDLTTPVQVPMSYSNYPQRIVFLANAESILRDEYNRFDEAWSGKNKKEIYDNITALSSRRDYWKNETAAPSFPMWYEYNTLIEFEPEHRFDGNGYNMGTIYLTRMVARIDIKVASAVNNFDLEEAWLYNSSDRGLLVPGEGNWQYANDQKIVITEPTLPTLQGRATMENPIEYQSTDNRTITDIYTFEAPSLEDDSHSPFLVIGGEYNEDKYYYKVEFENTTGNLPILRNHIYQFRIEEVTGPGHATKEEAANSIKANLSYSVDTWTTENYPGSLQGSYLFEISQSEFKDLRGYQTTQQITINTTPTPTSCHPDKIRKK